MSKLSSSASAEWPLTVPVVGTCGTKAKWPQNKVGAIEGGGSFEGCNHAKFRHCQHFYCSLDGPCLDAVEMGLGAGSGTGGGAGGGTGGETGDSQYTCRGIYPNTWEEVCKTFLAVSATVVFLMCHKAEYSPIRALSLALVRKAYRLVTPISSRRSYVDGRNGTCTSKHTGRSPQMKEKV